MQVDWQPQNIWSAKPVRDFSLTAALDNSDITTFSTSNTYYNHYNYAGALNERICYTVQANSASDTFTSRSNEVCIDLEPVLYMPNVFTPGSDSLNDVLKPINFGLYDAEFLIVSRNLNVVYRSNDVNKGWDGKFQGEYAPDGVYAYMIKARSRKGDFYKRGTFILLKN